MNLTRNVLPAALLCLVVFFAFNLFVLENKRRVLKDDLIELSKVKYGLFNVDEWKAILSNIITKKIEDFNLQGSSREEMRKKISELLYRVLGDFEQRYREENARSIKGFFREGITSFLGIFEKVQRDVPKFTEQILDFMNQPRNRKAVKRFILEKVNQYADKTFSKTDYSLHDRIVNKYHFKTRTDTIEHLTNRINTLANENHFHRVGLLGSAFLCALYLLLTKRLSRNQYLIVTVLSMVLLVLGLLIPMIEIDARIASMSFQLLGEPVTFQDQVLYYKSKSILEVVGLMLNQGRADLLFVGFLVFAFSVLFPVLKLFCSIAYLYGPRVRPHPLIRFMIFKSGKWSMADVMVIAIFMSYIGFSGIITEQLMQIEDMTASVEILTTNKSSLLTGFFSFTSFAILSLLISHKLQYERLNEPPL